ncbi:hypothetical protein AB0D11_48595 [Streptomyces monashensis]|uniref:hypothetical protein n=1 Tax=Streptomyces monashensis TaxID=1678012 RepID=UPI0033FC44F4
MRGASEKEEGAVGQEECGQHNVDDTMMVAGFRWVASGDSSAVAPEVLQTSGLLPLARRDTRPVCTGSEPDAGESA